MKSLISIVAFLSLTLSPYTSAIELRKGITFSPPENFRLLNLEEAKKYTRRVNAAPMVFLNSSSDVAFIILDTLIPVSMAQVEDELDQIASTMKMAMPSATFEDVKSISINGKEWKYLVFYDDKEEENGIYTGIYATSYKGFFIAANYKTPISTYREYEDILIAAVKSIALAE